MRYVYMITQWVLWRSNKYEYKIPLDYGRDCKIFALENEAEDALYKTETNYIKQGYTVVLADQSIKTNGRRMQYRLDKAGTNSIVLELWKKIIN